LEQEDTYRAALVRAAVALGGAIPLSRYMQVPMPDLTRWLAGDGRPPMGLFLKVIDLLLEESQKSHFHPLPGEEQPPAAPIKPVE
jgi:hypothetical protein